MDCRFCSFKSTALKSSGLRRHYARAHKLKPWEALHIPRMVCRCGCGDFVGWDDVAITWRLWIKGHASGWSVPELTPQQKVSRSAATKKQFERFGHPNVGKKMLSISIAKLGSKNAMFGIKGAANHRWKGGTSSGGYSMERMPDHPRAQSNGYVYKHILIAERTLGRGILKTEIVHHIDTDRGNNSESNLVVLESAKLHRIIHGKYGKIIGEAIKTKRLSIDWNTGVHRWLE